MGRTVNPLTNVYGGSNPSLPTTKNLETEFHSGILDYLPVLWFNFTPMKKELSKYLLKAGLSFAEAAVYMELLKAPAQTKWEVVKRTGLDRNKVYRSFEKLDELKLVDLTNSDGIKVKSLKSLVNNLKTSSRKAGNLAKKLHNLSPYLGIKDDSVQDFEMIYDQERLKEVYIMMSELKYDTVLDFGDFESFVPLIGDELSPAIKFRDIRSKHADCKTICTTDGPFTRCIGRDSTLEEFRSKMAICDMSFKDKWIIFSDTSDYVLFNDMTDKEDAHSVLVRSKTIADVQRMQFSHFSHMLEKA